MYNQKNQLHNSICIMKTPIQIISTCKNKVKSLEEMVPLDEISKRLLEIDEVINSSNIWSNQQKASALLKERQKKTDVVSQMSEFQNQVVFYSEVLETMPEELNSAQKHLEELEQKISEFEFRQMMSDPVDDSPAILSINSGAGGLEAANWVSILLRMYSRYADANNFKIDLLDAKHSEEHSSICIDSASISVQGPYAYGFLKGESGVHRLIRNSPFNSGDARHTSFASVSVTPDIEDIIDVKIDEKDIDITAQCSSGAGGQNVNKVHSAVRLRHLPTGINILVRSGRDFHRNKATAFKMLKAKLYDLEMKKKQAETDKQLDQQSNVSFGSQIRSYIMSPYTLCKDHRTDHESNRINEVLDGDIHEFILANLRLKR